MPNEYIRNERYILRSLMSAIKKNTISNKNNQKRMKNIIKEKIYRLHRVLHMEFIATYKHTHAG